MPLPDNGAVWPPVLWDEIYDVYEEHAAWYGGDPSTIAQVQSARVWTPTPKGRFWAADVNAERRVMLHVPIAADVAQTSADLLFSEQPKIRIAEAHEANAPRDAKAAEDRLAEIVDKGGIRNRLLEAAETAAAIGGVFLRPTWDKAVADYPILGVMQADAALPEFRFGILTAVTLWRELPNDNDDSTVWRHLERHEPGITLHGLYRGDSASLGRRMQLNARPETANLSDIVRLPWEGLGVRYVPNMRPNRRFRSHPRGASLGQSDYSAVEGLMDALDEVYTSWQRDIRLGKGRILAPAEFLGSRKTSDGKLEHRFDVDQEVYTMLDTDPTDSAGITIAQFEIRTEQHADTALNYIERIVSTPGYSPQSFGLQIEGRAESGTALRVRERKSFVTRDKKAAYWTPAIADCLQMLLQIDREIFGRPTPTDFRPSVQLEDSVAPSTQEIATSVELIARAQAASKATLVRMIHPDWSQEQVDAEVQEILEENGLALGDPIQNGVA